MGVPGSILESEDGLTSGMLPMVCRFLEQEGDCNVVDLGATSIDNCMLFSRFGARVYVDTSPASLRSRVVLYNELTEADIDNLIDRCPKPIDVLLFWDLMDYLSLENIKYVMSRLSGEMRPGGVLYTLASRQRFIPDSPAVIEMLREDCLRFLNDDPEQREAPQYAPKQLEQRMPGFVLDKMYLMQNGMQEHLFLFEGLEE